MSRVYVDATTLIALGRVGGLDLLANFDGDVAVLDEVRTEVTTEPARTNVERFCDRAAVTTDETKDDQFVARARSMLEEEETNGDVALVAAVLARTGDETGSEVGVVSDDARVRTVAGGLGATVTGTIGVVVRAVHEGMDNEDAKGLVRRLDGQGLHMTGELRETAFRLVDEAADERE